MYWQNIYFTPQIFVIRHVAIFHFLKTILVPFFSVTQGEKFWLPCVHDLKEISILESGFIQSTKKLTLYFCSKISSLKPFEFDDSFHHARYAIMRQPVGDTKTAKKFFNNFKIMQKTVYMKNLNYFPLRSCQAQFSIHFLCVDIWERENH